MSDLPELIVDCDPPKRNTVRIDGPLPTVTEWEEYPAIDGPGWGCVDHPLRVGDRVTLATEYDFHDCATGGPHPFATATVADVEYLGHREPAWFVTVDDVEAL